MRHYSRLQSSQALCVWGRTVEEKISSNDRVVQRPDLAAVLLNAAQELHALYFVHRLAGPAALTREAKLKSFGTGATFWFDATYSSKQLLLTSKIDCAKTKTEFVSAYDNFCGRSMLTKRGRPPSWSIGRNMWFNQVETSCVSTRSSTTTQGLDSLNSITTWQAVSSL